MLAFNEVHKTFPDGTRALRGVQLEIPRGQFCVILGPSGAGKSTLLRAVNGLTDLSSGEVTLDGEAVAAQNLRRLRQRTAMIHQQFNLTDRASVAANVLSGSSPVVGTGRVVLGWYPAELRAKACELIRGVGLAPEHLRRRVSGLSGGQQQRVGIARAFMLDPAVVLADEPVASLDPKISADILALLLRETRQRGTTALCSLHQVELARRFSDRVVAMRDGEIAYDGSPESLTDERVNAIYGSVHIEEPEVAEYPVAVGE